MTQVQHLTTNHEEKRDVRDTCKKPNFNDEILDDWYRVCRDVCVPGGSRFWRLWPDLWQFCDTRLPAAYGHRYIHFHPNFTSDTDPHPDLDTNVDPGPYIYRNPHA
jgi:hypothetical protein